MTVTDEMVENAAAAIHACEYDESYPFDRESTGAKELLRKQARAALTAALSDQVVVPEIIDNGKRNPLIVVSPDQVNSWLRSLADAAGYSDRGSCAIQVKVAHELGDTICLGSPELVLMVSNIKDSRPAPPPSSTAGEGK